MDTKVFLMDKPCNCSDPMSGAKKYQKKPTTVIAKQMDRDFMIRTAHGLVRAEAGDYFVMDIETKDKWPVKREIFERTYVIVEQPPQGI